MKIEKIFTMSATHLKRALRNELVDLGYNKEKVHHKSKFLYAEGDVPYMLVAHLDTVHKKLPSIICYSKDGNYMMSPQGIGGDDRCGVYIILSLLNKLSFKPYIVFTMDEEIGGIGASAFVKYINNANAPDLKYIVEFDRKGNEDCVFYDCDNDDFTKFVEGFGFKTAFGSFSDISTIAPALGVAAVNLSSGYYNPHTEHEYVSMNDMHDIIDKSFKMLRSESEKFEYVEKVYSVSKYAYKYGYGYDSDYYYSSYYNKKTNISASFVPEGAVYMYLAYLGECRLNKKEELVIDEGGNYYRYYPQFNDLSRPYNTEIAPVEDEPMYDPENAREFSIYSY